MKKGYTDIIMVLDESGSMYGVLSDTIGGVNNFLEEQRQVKGEAKFTLALFNTTYNLVHNGEDIKTVPELSNKTYRPRGMTALYDAIGRTIIETGSRFAKMDESERPEKVIFVILTDGHENSSVEINHEKVSEMIKHQTDKYKWGFVFLGANQDAFSTASDMGIQRGATMTYAASNIGTQRAFSSVSKGMTKARYGSGAGGQSVSTYFGEDDYKEQDEELSK